MSALAFCSCTENDLRDTTPLAEPTDRIEGAWAKVDWEGYTNRIYSFMSGKFYIYGSRDRYYYKDAALWNCPPTSFDVLEYNTFRIREGILYLGPGNQEMGEIKIEKDTLTIAGDKFYKLSRLTFPNPHQDQIDVTAVKLEKHDIYMEVGNSEVIEVVVLPGYAADKRIMWTSTNPSAVNVDQHGKVLAKAVCDTTVNVIASSLFSDKADTCRITVRNILSRKGTANSYIVGKGGYYCLDASVKGNSSERTGIGEYAEVVWETRGTSSTDKLIEDCSFDKRTDMLSFSVGPNVSGNALIALFDASGVILWSWHIWVSPGFDPLNSTQEYYNNAGTVMDRNLGALSADSKKGVLTYGLLYQWGRKDPFVSESVKTYFARDFKWKYVAVDRSSGNIPYSIMNPTAFLVSGGDWISPESDGYGDPTRWSPSEKTKYDPCPPGWRVPDYKLWLKAQEGRSAIFAVQDNGLSFKNYFSDADVWYPFAGCLRDGNPGDADVGRYWGAMDSAESSNTDCLQLLINRTECKIESCGSACGCSIRCIKE